MTVDGAVTAGSATAERYGDALADVYDLMYPWAEGPQIAGGLARLVEPGARALELGVGSGRIALALARSGVQVHGVDGSRRMLELLRRHDPTEQVTVTHGDFAVVDVGPAAFDLVYIACNTLFMVIGADAQVEVLRNARRHLRPDGLLVVEAYDPAPYHGLERPLLQARHLARDILMMDTVSTDPVEQNLVEIHTIIRPGTVDTYVEVSNYRWPGELDMMARVAGFEPVSRHGGWDDEPYTASSLSHVSAYRAPGNGV